MITKRFSEYRKEITPQTDLQEKLKISDFSFGFELEALLNDTGEQTPSSGKLVVVDKEVATTRLAKLEPLLGLMAKFGGTYMRDGSLKPYDARHTPFEYVSGVIPFTDVKLVEFTKALLDMKKKGVYTNDSCGFHIHFSFPDTTRKQLLWIKTVYLYDQMAQDNFEYFQSTHGPIPFWSAKYANPGNKKKLKSELTNIVKLFRADPNSIQSHVQLNKFFFQPYFTGKYTVLGIHEKYRTLEWRGPRGFLATGQTRDIILFVRTLRKFVQWLSSAEDTNRIVIDSRRGIYLTRQQFFDMIDHHSQKRVNTFAADIVDRLETVKSNAKRVDMMFEFFSTMDLASKSATNYRKIANKLRARYPTAWAAFQVRVKKERTLPEKIKTTIAKFTRAAGLESYNESRLSFHNYRAEQL